MDYSLPLSFYAFGLQKPQMVHRCPDIIGQQRLPLSDHVDGRRAGVLEILWQVNPLADSLLYPSRPYIRPVLGAGWVYKAPLCFMVLTASS